MTFTTLCEIKIIIKRNIQLNIFPQHSIPQKDTRVAYTAD